MLTFKIQLADMDIFISDANGQIVSQESFDTYTGT